MKLLAWLLAILCLTGGMALAEDVPDALLAALAEYKVITLGYYEAGTNGAAAALVEADGGNALCVLEAWRDVDWHITTWSGQVMPGIPVISSDRPGRFCIQFPDETGTMTQAFTIRRTKQPWVVTSYRNEQNAVTVDIDDKSLTYRYDSGHVQRFGEVVYAAMEGFDFAGFPTTEEAAREIRRNTLPRNQLPLPEDLRTMIKQEWPDWYIPYQTVRGSVNIDICNRFAYELHVYDPLNQGQAYIVLKRGDENMLCVFEKDKKGVWRTVVASKTALLQGAEVPDVYVEGAVGIVTVRYRPADPADDFWYTFSCVDGTWRVTDFYKEGISEDERYALAEVKKNGIVFADKQNDWKRITVKGKTGNALKEFEVLTFAELVGQFMEKLR